MKDAIVIVGRFQPFTLGHKSIIDAAKRSNPNSRSVIAMIKKSSSQLDKKNPFPSDIIKAFIDRVFHDVIVLEVKSANILEIADILGPMGYKVKGMYAGTDRVSSYKKMIDNYKNSHEYLANDAFVKELPRIGGFIATISATKVRAAIRERNFQEYRKMVPKALANKGSFELLQKYIK